MKYDAVLLSYIIGAKDIWLDQSIETNFKHILSFYWLYIFW